MERADMRHGTQYGYRKGCRCDECKAAKSGADKKSHAKHREKRLAASRERYAADPEKYRQRTRDRYASDPAYRQSVKATARRWNQANPERRREQRIRWEAENAEHLAALRRMQYLANRDKRIAAADEWRKANPERRREIAREWKRRNPDKVLAATNRRRALKAAATIAPFTMQQLEQRLSMFAGCWLCGGEANEIDHVKPLSKGGAHCLANFRPICGPCNQRKGARWPFDPAAIKAA